MVQIKSGEMLIAEFFSYSEASNYFRYELDLYRYPNAVIVCDDEQRFNA
jgi:hypothetical protein